MKRTAYAIVLVLEMTLAALIGCQRRPQAGRTAPVGTAPPRTQAAVPQSYPPDKTASQDTAGLATTLPEAATTR